MKTKTVFLAASLLCLTAGAAKWHHDAQLAGGEWKIQVQTPPCESYQNIQVIYPKRSGEPITIECDNMPVNEK